MPVPGWETGRIVVKVGTMQKVIQTQRLEIVNSAGEVKAAFFTNDEGQTNITIGSPDTGGIIILHDDEHGKSNITLQRAHGYDQISLVSDEARKSVALVFCDAERRVRATFSLQASGILLELRDNKWPRVHVRVTPDGAADVTVFNSEGLAVSSLPVDG